MNKYYKCQLKKHQQKYCRNIESWIKRLINKKHAPTTYDVSRGLVHASKATRIFTDNFNFQDLNNEIWNNASIEERRLIIYVKYANTLSEIITAQRINMARGWFYGKTCNLVFNQGKIDLPYTIPLYSSKLDIWFWALSCRKDDNGNLFRFNQCVEIYWTSHAIDQIKERLNLSNRFEDLGVWLLILFSRLKLKNINGVDFYSLDYPIGEDTYQVLYCPIKNAIIDKNESIILKTALLPGMSQTPYRTVLIEGKHIPCFQIVLDHWKSIWLDHIKRIKFLQQLGIWDISVETLGLPTRINNRW